MRTFCGVHDFFSALIKELISFKQISSISNLPQSIPRSLTSNPKQWVKMQTFWCVCVCWIRKAILYSFFTKKFPISNLPKNSLLQQKRSQLSPKNPRKTQWVKKRTFYVRVLGVRKAVVFSILPNNTTTTSSLTVSSHFFPNFKFAKILILSLFNKKGLNSPKKTPRKNTKWVKMQIFCAYWVRNSSKCFPKQSLHLHV